ncbi:DUF6973 domain-containing protein [Sediminicola sp. 1XM1-17]|uniref:DUF6973 domain-containing protein n=1 Tax=Sediminicola sp. 1XM1-17 TaxID=3127702 RepID=UPI003076D555
MDFWGVWRLVTPRDAWRLLKLLLRFPLFAYPTLSATIQCIRLCNAYFGRKHHKNNVANAFRHALWNFLIAAECKKWTRKNSKAVLWAELITNWHEDFSPNRDLARAMDLHNNEVGRNVFLGNGTVSKEEGITQLKLKLPDAIKIKTSDGLKKHTDRLVYIVDLK